MKGILSSYRWRRRLVWIGVVVLCAVGVVVAITALPKNSGQQTDLNPTGTIPVQTVDQFVKQVKVTEADRAAINATLVPFVRSGVTRKNPAAVWALATPAMRSAASHKQWNAGQLPVLPYPATIPNQPSWNVLSSYPGDVTVDLLLQPRHGSNRGPIAFSVELKRKTKSGRWLVDSMIPEQGFAPTPSAKSAKSAAAQQQQAAAETPSSGHGNRWLYLIPGGLLALIIVVPAAVLLNNWRKHRAIERRYRAERAGRGL